MKTYNFNTGVRPFDFNPPVPVMPGHKIAPNGVMVIPFDCDDVPNNAVFLFAGDDPECAAPGMICREIHNSAMVSKYAFFRKG